MTGQSKTLVIWFLFILQKITCSPVTILLGQKDRQCFYIEAKDGEYTAQVVLLSGGSVGFSEYKGSELILEKKIEMSLDFSTDDTSNNPPDLFKHKFSPAEGVEHEICLFSDRRFGREAKHVILDIRKLKGQTQPEESKEETEPFDDLDRIKKGIEEVDTLVTAIIAAQEEKKNRIIRRTQATKINHDSMGQSSLMETIVLVVVSVGQIILVRRWFQGKGTLLKQWA